MGSTAELRAVRRAGGKLRLPPLPKMLTAPEKQTALLAIEKRKKGKLVTVVRGLSSGGNDRVG